MEEEKINKEEFLKISFLKKIWYSIIKFERYPELAALGVKKALIYFTELMLIFTTVFTLTYIYYVSNKAEFSEENLTLSEKLATSFIGEENETEGMDVEQMVEVLGNYPQTTLICALAISFFISFFLATIIDVITLSLFGIVTCLVAKIKMNYKALFNMSIYALTFSIILRTIYFTLTFLTEFKIKYFDVMYVAIAYISLAAAIFMIKSDVIKQHLQIMKIIEEGKEKIEQTITIPKKPKEDEEENKDEEKKEPKEKNKSEQEGQGSNA